MNIFIFIVGFWYTLAPFAAGVILGLVQTHFFLRHDRFLARWWPVMTGLGAFMGTGFTYTLAAISSILFRDSSALLTPLYIVAVFTAGCGPGGFIISLYQFWLLHKDKWRYLVGSWVTSFAAVLAAIGVWVVYSIWFQTPGQDPVADQGDAIVFIQPITIFVTILVYGIGTSIVLARLRKSAPVQPGE